MVDQTVIPVTILGILLFLTHSTTQQTQNLTDRGERFALIELRSELGIRSKDWPIKPDPCLFWTGIGCMDSHVTEINISSFRRTRIGSRSPRFSADALARLPFLSSFNASRFYLPGPIPDWFGEKLASLRVLDLRYCSINGGIPVSLGNLSSLVGLYLSDNSLSGVIPSSLGQLLRLSTLDLARNSLTGGIPLSFVSLKNLTWLDLSGNRLSETSLSTIGTLSKLERLNLSYTGLSSSIPAQLGNLTNLVELDLSLNSLFGRIPNDLRGLRNLQKVVLGRNSLSGPLPSDLFPVLTRLQLIELNDNDLTGDIPNAVWSLPNLIFLDMSRNNFSGQLPNFTSSMNVTTAVLNISDNLLYGGLTSVLARFSFVNISGNYFEGDVPDYTRNNSVLNSNCLRDSSSQRSSSDCSAFYSSRGRVFDNFGLPNTTSDGTKGAKNNHKKWIIVGGVVGGIVFIIVLVSLVIFIVVCKRKKGTANQRGIVVGPVPAGGSMPLGGRMPPGGPSLDLSGLGEAFNIQRILLATDNFNDVNLIKRGHSGDLFKGILEGGVQVVIKKIDLNTVKKDAYKLELDFFSKVSHTRLVPLLGHCLDNENEKFLVYKYIPNGDLSSSLYRKTDSSDDSLQSLDWITRLKIAIGAAEGLSYLHHECSPPFVHRDVQASSVLLDDKFEVRLGSLSEVCVQEGEIHQSMITRLLRLPTTSEQRISGSTSATCAYDVYCFGKVLLELVTGKLGISASSEANMKEWLDSTMPHISIYDKELVQNIVDPSLLVDDDLLEEVWAMAIVARSCLNPKPNRRPLMRYILKALENPLKVVREEHNGESARLRTTSSRGSWNAALFGSWRQSSSDVAGASGAHVSKGEGVSSLRRSGTSNSQGSGQNGAGERSSSTRRQSNEVCPEPSDEQDEEREYGV